MKTLILLPFLMITNLIWTMEGSFFETRSSGDLVITGKISIPVASLTERISKFGVKTLEVLIWNLQITQPTPTFDVKTREVLIWNEQKKVNDIDRVNAFFVCSDLENLKEGVALELQIEGKDNQRIHAWLIATANPAVSPPVNFEIAYQNRYLKPLENNEYSKPLENNEYSKPLENNEYSKPLENNEYSKPLENSEYSKASENSEYSKASENSEYLNPLENSEYLNPLENSEYLKASENSEKSNFYFYSKIGLSLLGSFVLYYLFQNYYQTPLEIDLKI